MLIGDLLDLVMRLFGFVFTDLFGFLKLFDLGSLFRYLQEDSSPKV